MIKIHGSTNLKKIWRYTIQEGRADLFMLIGEAIDSNLILEHREIYNIIKNWIKKNNKMPRFPTIIYLLKECIHDFPDYANQAIEIIEDIMKMEINLTEAAELTRETTKIVTLRNLQSRIEEDLQQSTHDIYHYISTLQHAAVACQPDRYRENELDLDDILTQIIEMPKNRFKIGYPELDRRTKGIEPSTCWCIGAPTTVGKTMMTLNIAYNVAKQGIHVTFFSTEMIQRQIIERFLTIISGINTGRADSLTKEQISVLRTACKQYASLPIRIIYEGSLSEILRQIKLNESKLYIVDQIQTINSSRDQYNGEVKRLGYISSQLVDYAKRHKVCIIMTSQINRVSRSSPSISGYRGSGEIEENVDIGITLEPAGDVTSYKYQNRRLIKLKIGKNRLHGFTGNISYYFDPNTLRIEEHSLES